MTQAIGEGRMPDELAVMEPSRVEGGRASQRVHQQAAAGHAQSQHENDGY